MFNKNLIKIKRDYYSNNERSKFICLDANERPFEFSKSELVKINRAIISQNYTKYPKNIKNLILLISRREKISNKMISIHPGIDGCLKAIFESLDKNKVIKLNCIYPTYGMVEVYSKIFNIKLKKINEMDNFDQSIFDGNPKIIYIANPNSPSGNLIDTNRLFSILKKCEKKKIFLILDEAYIEFSNQKSFAKYIKKYRSLIVLKSYSKTFGLPGIRVGYMLSNPINIMSFSKLKSIYDVSSLSLAVISYFEKNYYIIKNYLKTIKVNKIYISTTCSKINLKYRITEGNFFYLIFAKKMINKIINILKKNKFLVKKINDKNLQRNESSIRITVGSISQLKELFKYIEKVKREL
jgi:histidinol-phosphate aminotransferase